VQGQLRWLRTFEVKRNTIPGVSFFYEGVISIGPDAYWVLFKDLPPGLPPAAQWNKLFVHDVRFNGYFLKVLRATNAKGSVTFPLLIGRTLEVPVAGEDSSLESSFWMLAAAVAGGGLVLGMVFWLHGLSERRYAARLAALRAKREAEPQEAGTPGVAENAAPNDNNPSDARTEPRLNGRHRQSEN
jgi:hypothetical protein